MELVETLVEGVTEDSKPFILGVSFLKAVTESKEERKGEKG